MTFVYLIIAIILEVIGTSALQASEQFTKPKPLILTALGYAASFYFLSLVLRTIAMVNAHPDTMGFEYYLTRANNHDMQVLDHATLRTTRAVNLPTVLCRSGR